MLNKKLIVSAFLVVSTAALLTGCGDDDKVKTYSCGNDAEALPEVKVKCNYVDMAAAVYSDSLDTAKELQGKVDALLEKPSEATLKAARDAYKATRKPYQQSEIMRFDEVITSGKNLGKEGLGSVDEWEGQVNAWPLDEDQIVSIISGSEEITQQLLIDRNGQLPNGTESEANVTTGVHAIEFLLWDQDKNGPARGPGNRQASEFGADVDCKDKTTKACRTSDYLRTATSLLVTDLTNMQAEWQPVKEEGDVKVFQEGSLAYNFLTSDQSVDYMLQAIANMAVGELGGARLSAGLWRPALLTEDKEPRKGDYEEEHDCFSDLSHYAVFYNFQGILNAWNGSYEKLDGSVVEGASLAELAKSSDKDLYAKLNVTLKDAQVYMDVIFDAGENRGISFDQIIGHSEDFYDKKSSERSAELKATESVLIELAKIEEIAGKLSDVMSLEAFDPDAIGETD